MLNIFLKISKQKQLYPKPEQMSREEHRRIYRETGEDADGRYNLSVPHHLFILTVTSISLYQ